MLLLRGVPPDEAGLGDGTKERVGGLPRGSILAARGGSGSGWTPSTNQIVHDLGLLPLPLKGVEKTQEATERFAKGESRLPSQAITSN